jgi:hypothetical protein
MFVALVLRTMCEEVQRLHALDLDADRLAHLSASNKTVDEERLKLFLSVALASVDALPKDMVLDGKNWPSLAPIRKAMPELERARGALNSYVHPNYGSHIAALFPERAAAAQLLLEAIVAVLQAFFALSWSEQPVTGRTAPIGVGSLESWPRTVERLQSHVLPEVQTMAGIPELAEVVKAPAIIEWLTEERADLEDMLVDAAGEALLEGLPRKRKGASADGVASESFRMWEGACAMDVLNLASARRAEKLLSEEFPSGAPDSLDQVRWLRFNAHSIGLAMLLDEVKAAAFKTQLARQIAQGNSLGILLCVRSLIEHRALASWLPATITTSLSSLAGQLQAGTPLPQNAAGVEQPLANFLLINAREDVERGSAGLGRAREWGHKNRLAEPWQCRRGCLPGKRSLSYAVRARVRSNARSKHAGLRIGG